MFVDEELDSTEIKSSWRKEIMVRDNGAQTRELDIREVGIQSKKRKEKECQTDDYIEEDIEITDDDSPEFAQFIAKAVPKLIYELERNMRSHAFDGYEEIFTEESDDVTISHTLTYPEMADALQITGLSWNATGAVIGASYGRLDHEDWCTHKSALCTWNLDRKGLDENKPDVVIDLPSCLTCIAFHPKKPACIAGATFNGEVMVWDTGREDETLIASSGIGDDSHREPVSKVQWVLDPDSHGKKYNIISIGADGKILVWQLDERKNTLNLIHGFVLLIESLPRHLRTKAKRSDQEMGVTCISFSPNDETTFLIGSESGGVFKCNANARGTPARRDLKCSVELRSPVTFSFETHDGPVHSVECSPYHRNLFLSCGTDTTARLYSILQKESMACTEPGLGYLYAAKWSPVRPLLYAVCTESGHLLFYDLKKSRTTPVLKLDASFKKKPVYSMQFNTHNTKLLATGDGAGCINVWTLGNQFSQQLPNEQELLEDIANVDQDAN